MPVYNSYVQRTKTAEVRFLEKVNKVGPLHPTDTTMGRCWLWLGCKKSWQGYGMFRAGPNNRRIAAHRFAFEHWIGPIPDGMSCLHTCDNTMCVNPEHLYLGTNDDNVIDKVMRGRTVSRFTENEVRLIRALYKSGVPQCVLSKRFNASAATICNVVHYVCWSHI